ncbi:sulfotransferase family cytosolic 1B member 1 [Aplysia californica]|uniref:Sulfotransferase family cytosolic 1B member 1 n=1 Tax=Aplysia californica TaxID=6500 RepID=A0ABM0ZVS3_APLCA|nr:sulfotransferase family cytosolic 1B member 1 [Aplysia californica]
MADEENHELLERARAVSAQMDLRVFEGVPYCPYERVNSFERMFSLIRGAELRPDDVITTGFLRSGNHWAFEILNMILGQGTDFSKRNFFELQLEMMGDRVTKVLQKASSPRVLTSHCQLRFLPRQAFESERKTKIVYILRNPKDAMVSQYKLMNSTRIKKLGFSGSWDEFVELLLHEGLQWGTWFDHVLSTDAFLKENPDFPLFILQFEKLREDPVPIVRDLCRFLGQPETLAEQIADATRFDSMKKGTEDKFGKMKSDFLKDDSSGFVVKGQIGSWRNEFTAAQSERFDRVFEKRMAGCSLADRVREYI